MKLQIRIASIFLLFFAVHGRKVVVKKFQMCDDGKDYTITFKNNFKTENEVQIVEEGSMKNKIEMGDNVKILANLYSMEDDGKYHFLITLHGTVCEALHKYLGDFGYELQKASGIEPGKCPIPVGDYKVTNHPLDFSMFKYKDVPSGELKVEGYLLDAKTNETLSCLESELKLE